MARAKGFRCTVGFLITVVGLATTPSAAAAAATDPCVEAAKHLRAGSFGEAEKAYRTLADAGKECPQGSALAALAARRLALARALARNGDYTEALKQLNAALEIEPVLVVPRSLKRVATALRQYAAARQLDSAGFHSAGVRLASQTRRRYPEVFVPADTQPLLEHSDVRFLGWLNDELKRYSIPWQQLVLIASAVIALVILVYFLVKWVRALARPRLLFAPFAGGAKADEPALSHGLTLETQQAVRRLDAEHGGAGRIDFATAAHSELKLPATLAGSPHFGFIGAILELAQLLFPLRDLTVSGHLQPAEPAGSAAVSLALAESNGRLFDDVTLRGSAFGSTPTTDADETYRRLITPAAVWTMFAVARRRKRPTPLGVRDWRAYALFAAATDWHQSGQVSTARRLYLQALALEPRIFRAELNLGLLEIRGGADARSAPRIKRGLERLERVRAALDAMT
jgi:tetratricopeptide (TPR) repeat protein